MWQILLNLMSAPIVARLNYKQIILLIHKPNHEDQEVWKELVESGQVVPIVYREYALSEAAQAIRDIGEGRVKGKAVVSIKKTDV